MPVGVADHFEQPDGTGASLHDERDWLVQVAQAFTRSPLVAAAGSLPLPTASTRPGSNAVTSPLAPFDETYVSDKHAVHRELRDNGAVQRVTLPDGSQAWLVTRESDVRRAFTDPRLSLNKKSSAGGYAGFSLPPALDANLLNIDPPDHTRLRKLVSHAFTRRRVDSLRGKVQAVTDHHLDRIADRESVDLIAEFATPLPLTVIGDLLGVPAQDRELFRGWASSLLAPDPSKPHHMRQAISSMERFLLDLVADKREKPTDDFLSDLIAVRDEGDLLTENELVSLAFLLLWAGYETTLHLIGNAILALIDNPQQLAALRSAPEISDRALEELVRYAHPNQYAIRRFPTEDITISGLRITAGDTVLLGIASANRDPQAIPNPDTLDLARKESPHFTFGLGIHYCLGAPLARLETRIAIESLLRRFPHIALAVPRDQIRWRHSFRQHGLQALPVTLRN
ncbi:cytochrome P450 [Nocardia terpenica]|uniref:cytochrome P450 family protein n=1 Tax=Nocardia terpenica TaxID=455432 RepID=UPI001895DA00|nr:cytochrome P450 [Nocardia terpenica]MBF6059423.1 cytochrome P450 [Nocardia terpenica]MBF6103038.1 cytochrome P450 [Nocardia terpenica]MBF6110773.1 cytochrome P450 [Nocardia terpenica]MBF6116904.1 cytochrome P450 [Nocardia terpenica]MBF6151258.1 cytochrome P450 [Nocardia terpenica]